MLARCEELLSAEGRYRIESVCGLRSTLMVAVDVEAVHRRLAAWIGSDPFEDRVGTIRLVAGDDRPGPVRCSRSA